ncbi:MAG TPA: hypothetical protein DEQ87_02095 [Algoriphagus sp.]|jgi:hypothetical protein|uniref:Uncharacterized protein n=1 Tax=Algoriphagus ornithinivorans TaxID=226506 RepID=A0A1I5JFL0_9BACT|nr:MULTISPECIES: hypothetical protein [Algoriphagus]MAL13152.1 hypothetical protein [Algoriphagus sp.]MAN87269.1 hypothetical protein [Algoriphagus sp.]QYH41091.1 hypothetical protein GYM62_20655 [Algoriphagus sp. NBT04N3]SFO71595.1 hypothetical protein SAMN04488519_11275 [Algoriphagus ornithinivorans]HAD50481.1 hypothetical protein [Algoriphagus sp.]|tara:strand:+ start:1421 stop:1822 length:402 start_codon:yes stop_codon:yes gene_type:complete
MKKDIDFSPVTGVKLAIAKEETASGTEWGVYIINLNLIELNTVMITSKGYGEIDGEQKKTSILRHMIKELGPECVAKIEPIDPQVFALTNEFWVSYYILDQIFDKKFIFTPGSFDPSLQRMIPELGLEGVLHS